MPPIREIPTMHEGTLLNRGQECYRVRPRISPPKAILSHHVSAKPFSPPLKLTHKQSRVAHDTPNPKPLRKLIHPRFHRSLKIQLQSLLPSRSPNLRIKPPTPIRQPPSDNYSRAILPIPSINRDPHILPILQRWRIRITARIPQLFRDTLTTSSPHRIIHMVNAELCLSLTGPRWRVLINQPRRINHR